jgi:hypothetical protein
MTSPVNSAVDIAMTKPPTGGDGDEAASASASSSLAWASGCGGGSSWCWCQVPRPRQGHGGMPFDSTRLDSTLASRHYFCARAVSVG